MPWQLIYTSAPRGFLSGQTGFCTVARSRDLREALAQRLEQLSSYHYLRVAEAATPGRNPTVCAFRNLDLRGTKYQVLTRIQPCGLDFTARTNHLAHHLVFQSGELNQLPSPAAILRFWDGWVTSWQGDPRLLDDPAPESFAAAGQSCLPAQTWLRVTGDAGRAAGLLEGECVRGCYLVCPPDSEQQVLEMYSETLQLLNLKGEYPLRPWRHSFTTFLQAEDNPADFQWRACQEGSPAHQQAVQGTATLIPLRSVRVPANSLVKPAREGLKPPAPPPESGPTDAIIALRKRETSGRERPPDPAMEPEYWKTPAQTWDEPVRPEKPPFKLSPTAVRITAVLAVVLVLFVIKIVRDKKRSSSTPIPPPTTTQTAPTKTEPSPAPAAPVDKAQLDHLTGDCPTYIFVADDMSAVHWPIDAILRFQNFLQRFDHLETRPTDIQLSINTDTWDASPGVPITVDGRQTQALTAHTANGIDCNIDYSAWKTDNHNPVAIRTSFPSSPRAFSLHFGFADPNGGEPFRLLVVNENNGPAPLHMSLGWVVNRADNALSRALGNCNLAPGLDWQLRPFVATANARQAHYLYKDWPAEDVPASGGELDFAAVKKHLAAKLAPLTKQAAAFSGKLAKATTDAALNYPLGDDLRLTNRNLTSLARFAPEPSTADFVEYLNRLKKSTANKKWPRLFEDDDDTALAAKFQQLHDLWPQPIAGFTNYFATTWQNLKELEKIRQEKKRVQDDIDRIQGRLSVVPDAPQQTASVGLFIIDPPKPALEMIRFEGP
jgi:hypothetical protein